MILLVAESDDYTASYLAEGLREANLRYQLVTPECVRSHSGVSFSTSQAALFELEPIISSDISTLVLRRPVRFHPLRADCLSRHESLEWAEVFEAKLATVDKSLWINDPAASTVAANKILQLCTVNSMGFRIPKSLVTTKMSDLEEFIKSNENRIIVKPLSVGYIENECGPDSIVYTTILENPSRISSDALAECPTLFQEFIEKDFDVRTVVVDDEITSVGILNSNTCDGGVDVRRDEMRHASYWSIETPRAVGDMVRSFMNRFLIRYCAFDFVVDKNQDWVFLEGNPEGQWAWLDLEGGQSVRDSFVKALRYVENSRVK